MSDKDKTTAQDLAFLGRGVGRTFVRDILAIAAGVGIGAVLGLVAALVTGFTLLSGVKLGALAGAFIGLALRSFMRPLFDYDQPGQGGRPRS